MEIKTIGVLTSGGDAPGMNAAVRAVVRMALSMGYKVKGIKQGYRGLLDGNMFDMTARDVSGYLQKGGTMLETARCLEFKTPEGIKAGAKSCRDNGIDALVVVGGDGTFMGARALANEGIRTVAIPGTIDNDISCTEYTIGFDTALNTALSAADKLRDTCESHHRCSVLEVMGAGAGYVAVEIAIACGAEAVLVPEYPYDLEKDVIEPIRNGRANGRKHSIVVVSELMGIDTRQMAKEIEEKTGVETRATILGHVQRGGSPTVKDRVTATKMGVRAVELLAEGKSNRVVGVENGKIADYDITEGLSMKKTVDEELYKLVGTLSK